MPYFVSSQLAQTGVHCIGQELGRVMTRHMLRHQSFKDEIVLVFAKRAERYNALNDLSGSGILNGVAIGPAPRRTMDPLDEVVAHVHGIRVSGQQLNLKGVAESGGLEGLIPPACSFYQGHADRGWSAGIDVVDDGLDGIADGSIWILLHQAVTRDVALDHGFLDGRGEVHEFGREEASAWVLHSRS